MIINAESVKELINPELTVQLGEPAYSKVGKNGLPDKTSTPVYDDPRLTSEDVALIEAVVENPTKLETKGEQTIKEVYKVEVEAKVALKEAQDGTVKTS